MRYFLGRTFAPVSLLLLAAGCMPVSLSVSGPSGPVGPNETAVSFSISNSGDGRLEWSASASETWIEVMPPSGVGDGEPTLLIDRDSLGLDSLGLGLHSATVTVTSNGGTASFVLEVDVTATLGSRYWPLAVGNRWEFGGPPYSVGALFGEGDDTALILGVSDFFEMEGFGIWEFEVELPNAMVGFGEDLFETAAPPGLISRGTDPLYSRVSSLAGLFAFDPGKTLEVLADSVRGTFYVTLVDGAYWVAPRIEVLDNLPATTGFIPWEDFIRAPGRLLTAANEELAEEFLEDVFVVGLGVAGEVTPLIDELMAALESDVLDRAAVIGAAYGARFADYSSGSVVVEALARFMALAAGDGAVAIRDAVVAIDELTRTSLRELLEFTPFMIRHLASEDGPAGGIDAFRGFGSGIQSLGAPGSPTASAADLLGGVLVGIADVAAEVESGAYSLDDEAMTTLLQEAGTFLDTLPEPPFVFFGVNDTLVSLAELLENPEPSSAAAVAVGGILAVMTRDAIALLDAVAEAEATGDDDAFRRLTRITGAVQGFFNSFLLDPDQRSNPVAVYFSAYSGLLNDVVGIAADVEAELVGLSAASDALDFALNTAAADDVSAAAFAEWFAAQSEFFAEYDATFDDPVAEILAAVTGGAAEISLLTEDFSAELQRVTFSESTGTFESFLPLRYQALGLELSDFAIDGDTSVAVLEGTLGGVRPASPVLVLGRDIGPVALYLFPLQRAELAE